MKYLSKALTDGLYAQTEISISKAVSVWQQMPTEFFTAQPGPGKWSAVQCLEHLNSYGRYYLPAIEKAINSNKHLQPATHFKSGLLGNYFYKLMLPALNGTVKKKMRSPKDHRPAEQLNTVQVLAEFISQLEKLGQLISLSQQTDLNKVKVPISIAPFIKLKLGDTLLFYTAHIQRHLQQAARAMQAAGYQPYLIKNNRVLV
jgi:DinB superfamily